MKAGYSNAFAVGFDEALTGDELEFMLDELLFNEQQDDLVLDFLGQPIDDYQDRDMDDLITELQDHPLVKAEQIRDKQDEILSTMTPGKLDQKERREKFKELHELSKEERKNLENTNLVLIYKTQQDGRVDDVHCLPREGEVWNINDPNRPIIPDSLHPGCRCYWEDSVTGQDLGQF